MLTTLFPDPLSLSAVLFSVNAVGMYTNIDAKHRVEVTICFMKLYGDRIKDFNMPYEFVAKYFVLIMQKNILI